MKYILFGTANNRRSGRWLTKSIVLIYTECTGGNKLVFGRDQLFSPIMSQYVHYVQANKSPAGTRYDDDRNVAQ